MNNKEISVTDTQELPVTFPVVNASQSPIETAEILPNEVEKLTLDNFNVMFGLVMVELFKPSARTKAGVLKSEQQMANEQYNGVEYHKLPKVVKVNQADANDPNAIIKVGDRILTKIDKDVIKDYGLVKWEVMEKEYVFLPVGIIQGVIRI